MYLYLGTRQERLACFYQIFAPDQVDSAGEVAGMFCDDLEALQHLLKKRYGAGLGAGTSQSFQRAESTCVDEDDEDVEILIQHIEQTLCNPPAASHPASSHAWSHASDHTASFQEHLCHLTRSAAAVPTLEASADAAALKAGGSGGGGGKNVEGFLDMVREKTEEIARLLPLRLIPLDSLLRSIQTSGAAVDGKGQVQHEQEDEQDDEQDDHDQQDVALVHAVLAECRVLNRLLQTVHESLRQVDMVLLRNSAVEGSKARANACAQCLIAGQVPQAWIACSYPASKPLAAWLRDLADLRLPQVRGFAKPCASVGSLATASLM